jgi:hypothetical protein
LREPEIVLSLLPVYSISRTIWSLWDFFVRTTPQELHADHFAYNADCRSGENQNRKWRAEKEGACQKRRIAMDVIAFDFKVVQNLENLGDIALRPSWLFNISR